MNEVFIAVIIVVVFSLVPCGLLAYSIGIKQQRQWLAGYDEAKLNNPHAYARLIAIGILCMGVFISLTAIVWGLVGLNLIEFIIAICVASFSIIPFVVYANIKYKKI